MCTQGPSVHFCAQVQGFDFSSYRESFIAIHAVELCYFCFQKRNKRQQFCDNKKQTHFLLNLRILQTLFFNFNSATFFYISVNWWFCGLPQRNVGISAGLDIAFNAPWRGVFYPVTVTCQFNGVIIRFSGNILAEKPSLSLIATHIVQFISECFITFPPRPSKAHTLI